MLDRPLRRSVADGITPAVRDVQVNPCEGMAF